MNLNRILSAAIAAIILPLSAIADTEVVDGIEWTYYTFSNGGASVGSYYGGRAVPITTSGAITIPTTLGGQPVTSIGSSAFLGCSGLTSVTIPVSFGDLTQFC
jgi:hypothetical protein